MAFKTFSKFHFLLYNYRHIIGRHFYRLYSHEKTGVTFFSNEDVISFYTSQLLKKSGEILDDKKEAKTAINYNEVNEKDICHFNIKDLSSLHLHDLIENAILEKRVVFINYIMKQCLERNIELPNNLYFKVLDVLATNGETELIDNIRKKNRKRSNYDHYFAKATWIKGDVPKALNIFEELYEKEPYARRKIRHMMEYLIKVEVSNQSEAILINIIKFSEDLAANYNDYFCLTNLWQACFLSEWYSDQQVALELLNKHDRLMENLIPNVYYVVAVSLQKRRVDVVYRLLELLLSFEMKTEYTIILCHLFKHELDRKNLKSCYEIANWCKKQEIALPRVYQEQYLQLLLQDNPLGLIRNKSKTIDRKFNLKF